CVAVRIACVASSRDGSAFLCFFFFKQKTAYEIGLGIPAEPLFRSEYPFLDLVGLGGKSAADKGKDTRDYLAAAFPELNAWERAGADRSEERRVGKECRSRWSPCH